MKSILTLESVPFKGETESNQTEIPQQDSDSSHFISGLRFSSALIWGFLYHFLSVLSLGFSSDHFFPLPYSLCTESVRNYQQFIASRVIWVVDSQLKVGRVCAAIPTAEGSILMAVAQKLANTLSSAVRGQKWCGSVVKSRSESSDECSAYVL